MLKNDLNELISLVNMKNNINEDDFNGLWELYFRKEDTDIRTDCIGEYSDVFWYICSKGKFDYQSENFETHIENMKKFISFLSRETLYADDMYEKKSVAFVSFLGWLMSKAESYDASQVEKFNNFIRKLSDVIGSVKWIFRLEKGGEKIFPIHRLLDDAVTDFKLTNERYLQLVFSLQLFNRIEDISKEEADIKERMLKLSNEYNLEIIKMLCNDGQLLYGENAGINSARNGTIVVVQGNKILIRNVNSSYFDGDCQFEGNVEENAIAYYITYNKENHEELTSFKDIMKSDNNSSKLQLFKDLLQKKIYNVFLGDTFLVNERDKSYSRVINKFSKYDDYIISDKKVFGEGKPSFEAFWNKIEDDQNGIRISPIMKSGRLNVLTLDFLLIFCKSFCSSEDNFFDELLDLNDDDYYQNQMFRKYIEIALENGDILDAMRKYGNFLLDFLNAESVSTETSIMEMKHIIFPYSIYVPFDGEENKFLCELIDKKYIKEDVDIETLVVNKKKGNINEFKVGESVIDVDKIFDLSGTNIDVTANSSAVCFYARKKHSVYLLKEYSEIIEIINKISNFSDIYVFDKTWMTKLTSRFDSMLRIITSIGFDHKTYSQFGSRNRDKFASSIALYKFMWLMQVFQFNYEKYKEFEEMILEKFYCEFVLNEEEMMKNYLEKIECEERKNSLIISKETSGSGATLKLLISRYSNEERGPLMMAFDEASINKNIQLKGNLYYYMEKQIEKIVFLTDNSLSGDSTVKMLKFYLKNEKDIDDKREYLFRKETNKIVKIMETNPKVKIDVRTIFYSERAEKRIKKELSEYNIKIKGDKLNGNSYKWTKEINDTLQNLFEVSIPKNIESVQCVLRPCNMPFDKILPVFLKEELTLISIFRHKDN